MKREITRGPREISEAELAAQIEEVRQRRFLKAMALKSQVGLNDDERHSLAQMLPGVDKDDGGSWKDLNPKQLHDMICMLEGYLFVTTLLGQRITQTYTSMPNLPNQSYTLGTSGNPNQGFTYTANPHTHQYYTTTTHSHSLPYVTQSAI